MIEEFARHCCVGDDGSTLVVVEQCYVFFERDVSGARHGRGAAFAALLDGEPVRYIDADTFEVIATGEFLNHDRLRCACASAKAIVRRGRGAGS